MVEYVDGYNHYDKQRKHFIIFRMNEAEKAFLDDLVAATNARSISAFLRSQAFRAYRDLTPEQKEKMREVAEWRATDDVKCEK